MSVSVCCPGCQVACEVPPELLGRTGRCNECGRRLRLATPTAELLDSPQEELAPLDELGELEPIGNLAPLDAAAPAVPAPEPVALQPTAGLAPRPKRARAVAAPPARGPSKVLIAVLAIVGLIGGGASGALLVKYLLPPEQPVSEQRPGVESPAPALPEAKPQPNPPDPKSPEPKPPEPKPPEAKVQPGPMLAGPKSALKLSAPAITLTAGGGGRFVVFQTASELAVYDAQLGRIFWTLKGSQPDDLVAVGRTKLFLGRGKDAKIVRFDLATGASEGQATWEGAAAPIKHLAIGSASDGPLLVVARLNESAYRVRLHDPETFAELAYPIDDPLAPAARGFPFTEPSAPQWVASGADGRVLMLGNRYFARTEDRYRSALLPGTGSSPHLPTTDGGAFVGTKLFSADGAALPPPDLPPGTMRRYIPAASGPFVVSVEYSRADPSAVKLWLHLGTDPKPLGPLPGAEEVSAWAKDDLGWVAKLHQRLIFAPDPGQLIFCAPGATAAQVYPIDLPGMLRAAGLDIVFTSTPPAEAHTAPAYTYRATAATTVGPVTFALQTGPAGMTVTRDGVLTWPRPSGNRPSIEVVLVASAGGKKALQSFRVQLPRKGAEREPPKKEPE
jgi:hypothetical protein